MRAAVITGPGGPEVLRIEEREEPDVVADQVRVRVLAAGLNRADLLQRRGGYAAPAGSPQDIPGLEIAGVVDRLGPGARHLQVGNRVFGIVGGGAHAEYVVTTEDLLSIIPPQLDDVAAGAVPEVFMTAYDALFRLAGLRIGERVLIHAAASGVGTAAIQLARAAGATVWGTVRTEAKRTNVLDLGARDVFAADGFATEVRAATGGEGVDVVLDFVGAPYLGPNLEALAEQGRLVIVGLMGGANGSLDLGTVMRKRLRIIGTVLRSRSRTEKAALTAAFGAHVVPLLSEGRLRVLVDRVFPLTEIAAAHAYMESNANVGKIVLTI